MSNKHAVRCDKDHRTAGPSNISKRELEDLYYSLLENNLELKKTINAQSEQNRILSTKVQRMTAQSKTAVKDCCAAAKAIINEQKAGIEELTRANEALSERIRKLNTQLGTAKQFLNQNPSGRTCYKCFATSSAKAFSSTSLQNKSTPANVKSAATSATQIHQEPPSIRTAGTNTLENYAENVEKKNAETMTKENKGRSEMEQFKQQIQDLEEELAKTHSEYSNRLTQLEEQVSQLRPVRSQLDLRDKDSQESVRGLHNSGAEKATNAACGGAECLIKCSKYCPKTNAKSSSSSAKVLCECKKTAVDLETELAIEKRKVAELEMRLKASKISQHVARTIEDHISSGAYQTPGSTSTSNKTPNELAFPDDKLPKSDDSEYAEHKREMDTDEKTNHTNQDLLKRINDIQAQLDALKLINEMQLKASKISQQVARTIENQISSGAYQTEEKQLRQTSGEMTVGDTASQPAPISTSNKTPNELAFPEDKLSKSDDSGYAEHKRETDTDEKNNQTNQELLKRINEIQAQLDALKLINAEKDTAIQEPSRKVDRYTLDNEMQSQDKTKNIFPNQTTCDECQITEPKTIAAKELQPEPGSRNEVILNDEKTNTTIPDNDKLYGVFKNNSPTKDNKYPYKLINKANSESDKDSPRNDMLQAKDSCQQAVVIDGCVKYPHKNKADLKTNDITEENYNGNKEVSENNVKYMVNKEDPLVTESNGDKSKSNLQKGVEIVKRKPVHFYANAKPNVNSLDDNQPDLSTVSPHPFSTPKPNTTKVDDIVQLTPGHLQISNDSVPKRRLTLTKRKVKPVGNKKKIEESKHSKFGKNKNINGKDNNIRDLPLDAANNKNDVGRVSEYGPPSVCEHHVTFCTCFETPGPPLSLYQLRSGTHILATFQRNKLKKCSCSDPATCMSNMGPVLNGNGKRETPIASSTPKNDKAISPHTYTVESDKSRTTSPANTEHEISVMTDLPSEKDDLYGRLSPGEKRTTTSTSTETNTARNGYTLSEGEVPVNPERRMSKSLGEVRRNDHTKNEVSFGEQQSPREKMEATLHVISQELARCRSLLQTRPREKSQNVATDVDPVSLHLRRTEGKSQFEGTVAPSCVFTMHVVSLVLSDEAIVKSHDANLVLKWQFEQKTTMAPLAKGRVTHFEFSTQYELQMTAELEEYLRNEGMLIMICEMDSIQKPFATCQLPLRHALMNMNKRVDMSLPLGADRPYHEDSSGKRSNDDMGVLDVWCMLICK